MPSPPLLLLAAAAVTAPTVSHEGARSADQADGVRHLRDTEDGRAACAVGSAEYDFVVEGALIL